MLNTSSQSAARLKSYPRNWTVPGKRGKKPLEEILASPRTSHSGMGGWGEEGARAEWIGAARSQPGSFIEIFLNNLHVLVSCVSSAVSGSVIPTG